MLVPLEKSRNSFYNWLNGHDLSPRTFLARELATSKWNIFLGKKGVSLERNCGAALVGEYNRVIYCFQLSWKRKLATVKNLKADVSSVSPHLERYWWPLLEGLNVLIGFTAND